MSLQRNKALTHEGLLEYLYRSIVFTNLAHQLGPIDEPFIFRSYDFLPLRDQRPTELPLSLSRGANFAAWKVARAATAAALYFKPLEVAFDDKQFDLISFARPASPNLAKALSEEQDATKSKNQARKPVLYRKARVFGLSNPSIKVLKELRRNFRDGPEEIANWVSIGTARRISPGISHTFSSILKKATFDLGDPASEHERMTRLQEFDYYRLDEPNGLPDVDGDDWKPRGSRYSGGETMEIMKAAFNKWVAQPANQAAVQQAARSLVEIRRARTSDTLMWERFALGRLFF